MSRFYCKSVNTIKKDWGSLLNQLGGAFYPQFSSIYLVLVEVDGALTTPAGHRIKVRVAYLVADTLGD
jgi:hypothetical protein